MTTGAAFASSVGRSMPTVFRVSKPASATRSNTHVQTPFVRLDVAPPPRPRDREVVGRNVVQRDVQELPQAQRIGRSPRHRPFRLQAFEVAEQQHSKVAARRQRRTPDSVGVELRALLFDESVEAGIVETGGVKILLAEVVSGDYSPTLGIAARSDAPCCRATTSQAAAITAGYRPPRHGRELRPVPARSCRGLRHSDADPRRSWRVSTGSG